MYHIILTNDIRSALDQMKHRSYVINKKEHTARLYGQNTDTIKLVHIARLDKLYGIRIDSFEEMSFDHGSLILDTHEMQMWKAARQTCQAK